MNKYIQDGMVTEIKSDFDPWNREYTQISIGYRLPNPPAPPELKNAWPPPPVPVVYKHIVHLFIPKNEWRGQYQLWEKVRVIVNDDGSVEVLKI